MKYLVCIMKNKKGPTSTGSPDHTACHTPPGPRRRYRNQSHTPGGNHSRDHSTYPANTDHLYSAWLGKWNIE